MKIKIFGGNSQKILRNNLVNLVCVCAVRTMGSSTIHCAFCSSVAYGMAYNSTVETFLCSVGFSRSDDRALYVSV